MERVLIHNIHTRIHRHTTYTNAFTDTLFTLSLTHSRKSFQVSFDTYAYLTNPRPMAHEWPPCAPQARLLIPTPFLKPPTDNYTRGYPLPPMHPTRRHALKESRDLFEGTVSSYPRGIGAAAPLQTKLATRSKAVFQPPLDVC